MTDRATLNFSAGPGILPEPVLRRAQQDLWDIFGTGIGVSEHSHRGPAIDRVFDEAEADFREVGAIPDSHRVLFMTGGATQQFFQVPMNFLRGGTADYINTGAWSQKAIKEARRFGEVNVAASSEDKNFTFIPPESSVRYSAGAKYVHFTSNNTIFGTQFRAEPANPNNAPLVCDASSDIFSKPIDVSRYALVYCGAQKNLGPAGVTVVFASDAFLAQGEEDLPEMLRYSTFAENGSRANTPPVLAVYMVGQVVKWIRQSGGLRAMAERNAAKARILYDHLDATDFFRGTAEPASRSLMNVTFRGPSEELEKKFLKEAEARGLSGLKGHRSVGGMRASIYNAFPEEGVRTLVEFMKEFEQANR